MARQLVYGNRVPSDQPDFARLPPAEPKTEDPDIMCEVFILAPTNLVDEHEIRGRLPPPAA